MILVIPLRVVESTAVWCTPFWWRVSISDKKLKIDKKTLDFDMKKLFLVMQLIAACRDGCSGGCRRKREIKSLKQTSKLKQRSEEKVTLWGCTPWWAQLSVCMNTPISTFRSAFESSEWYNQTEAETRVTQSLKA